MDVFAHPSFNGHEAVTFAQNSGVGVTAIIAIHDARPGPALGGGKSSPGRTADEVALARLERGAEGR